MFSAPTDMRRPEHERQNPPPAVAELLAAEGQVPNPLQRILDRWGLDRETAGQVWLALLGTWTMSVRVPYPQDVRDLVRVPADLVATLGLEVAHGLAVWLERQERCRREERARRHAAVASRPQQEQEARPVMRRRHRRR